jgi:hypothetical protein
MRKILFVVLSFCFAGVASAASLTANAVPRATAANIIADGIITDTGVNIGINSTSPTSKLAIDGTIYAKNLTSGGSHGAAQYLCLGLDGVIYGQSGLCR